MNRTLLPAVALVSAALLGGCANKTNQEQAEMRWQDARARVMVELASDQLEQGSIDDARASIERARAASPRLAESHILAARCDLEEDNLRSAADALVLARMLEAEPKVHAEAAHLQGVIAERWRETDEAVRRHRESTVLNPIEPAYAVALAETLVAADQANEAAELLERRLPQSQGEASIFDALGQVYQALGRNDEAAEMFRRAVIYAPNDDDLAARAAFAMLEAGDPASSVTTLRRLAEEPHFRDRPSTHVALGEALLADANPREALRAFQTAARLDRTSRAAWLGVAKAALDRRDAAVADQALQRLPSDDVDADLLRGLVRYRQGRFAEAAATLEPLAPNDPTAACLRSLCLIALDDQTAMANSDFATVD